MREFLKAIITAPFLQTKIDEYFDKRATAGPGASPGGGRPVWIIVVITLAVIVAVIAIVVTYWAEILFAGLAVLAFHYRKPISRFVRRIAAACSGTQAEPENLPPLEESPIEESVTAAQLCGNCRKPNIPPAPFCRHCGSHIAALPPPPILPPPPPPILPPRIEQPISPPNDDYGVSSDMYAYAFEHNLPLCGFAEGTAEPIRSNTCLNIPALCSRTGQVFFYVCEYHRDSSDGYWLVTDTKIPQNRAAASALASARMADVHSSFRLANGFAGCPYCRAKSFYRCRCKTVNCDSMTRYENGKEQSHCEGCGTWGDVVRGEGILEIHALEQPVNERKELVPSNNRSVSAHGGSK
jgi:hypothetical protein